MPERTVTIVAPEGLHARPAALFVQAVKASGTSVTVAKGDKTVNAGSILGVITLGAMQGDEVVLAADDAAVLDELVELLSSAH